MAEEVDAYGRTRTASCLTCMAVVTAKATNRSVGPSSTRRGAAWPSWNYGSFIWFGVVSFAPFVRSRWWSVLIGVGGPTAIWPSLVNMRMHAKFHETLRSTFRTGMLDLMGSKLEIGIFTGLLVNLPVKLFYRFTSKKLFTGKPKVS